MQPSRRTFQDKNGKWIEKLARTEILVCKCGLKYIKTRDVQPTCLTCMHRPRPSLTQ